ncbi:MAG: hypothetical protein PUJ51_08330 [Clostridiales bacterium]|nr:hypothetical protein [Clostridiales bacterium]
MDYQSRVQGMRERSFELLLEKSIYRIDFDYDGKINPGVFEKYKQDETRTLHYLLTRTNLNIPNGTILMLSNKDEQEEPWMIYYLEDIKASGYNRYIMLKMTHYITWKARDNKFYSSWAYLYGQENNMLKDELQARSRADARYTENLKTSFFILPINEHIRKDDYLVINENTPLEEAYVVTGYDINSTKGVEYITIDPVYIRDKNPDPIKTETDSNEDFFWIEGGI